MAVDIRGEVYIGRHDFVALNEARAQQGLEPMANPRNAASGSLRQLDPEMTRGRRLGFFAYAIEWDTTTGNNDRNNNRGLPPQVQTQCHVLDQLKQWGFKVAEPYSLCHGGEALMAFHESLEGQRDQVSFDIDGVVYKINDLSLRAALGHSARAPRWAMAHKFSPVIAETTVQAIEIQVG